MTKYKIYVLCFILASVLISIFVLRKVTQPLSGEIYLNAVTKNKVKVDSVKNERIYFTDLGQKKNKSESLVLFRIHYSRK